ncbi:MAG: phosphoribosylglycinamide formyltransferase [Bacteroidales bacterium]|nr:phosphoribosylglycinamide formyltransferase [Bacteroidales bacterium]
MKRLSIFVSGNGTNLQRIAEYFSNNKDVEIVNVVCNNPKAYSIERAKKLGIPLRMITKEDFKSEAFVKELHSLDIDLIILAGFLWKLPENLVKAFPKKIVNIHPALLPKYGGKGFYGEHVHEAVVAAKEAQSGITVHYVNELYDSGEIILQARVSLDENETPDSLAAKIHQLEQAYFPVAIEQVLFSNALSGRNP